MPFNYDAPLWPGRAENHFRDRNIEPLLQVGPHCVATALAMVSGDTPESFKGRVNTQDPVSWSVALNRYDMKLAYCPCDVRRVQFYIEQLEALDDLFLVSYYTAVDDDDVMSDPDPDGWLCGSHVVVVHQKNVLDPALGIVTPLREATARLFHTKRIFRVIPMVHSRGL